jgi:hypothetical protein
MRESEPQVFPNLNKRVFDPFVFGQVAVGFVAKGHLNPPFPGPCPARSGRGYRIGRPDERIAIDSRTNDAASVKSAATIYAAAGSFRRNILCE